MAREFAKIDYNKINYDDVIFVDTRLENAQGLKSVMLLAKVLSIKEQKLEVEFIASDSSAIWVPTEDCYHTNTNKVERFK